MICGLIRALGCLVRSPCVACLASSHIFIFKKLEYSSSTFPHKITFNLKYSHVFLSCGRWNVTPGLACDFHDPSMEEVSLSQNTGSVSWGGGALLGVVCKNKIVEASIHQGLKAGHLIGNEVRTLFCLLSVNIPNTNI